MVRTAVLAPALATQLLVFAVAVALAAHPAVVAEAGTTPVPSCAPGTYAYNQSGSFVCLPPVKAENLPFIAFSTVLNGSTLYLRVVCLDPRGCNVTFTVLDPNGTRLYTGSEELNASENYAWNVALPQSYGYVVMNMSVDNYVIGPYAIPSITTNTPVVNVKSMDPRVAIIFLAAVAAPPVALVLRHNPKESGIALVLLSFLYTPLMFVFGIPFPIPEIVASVMFILGVLLIATTRS